ncbi:EamA family transporter [Granulicella sp. 5B5]|nr:EamA family transporter [Granulicella sp. 5B5]
MGAKSAGKGLLGTMRFVMLAQTSSLAVLLVLLVATHASLPHGAPMWWALAAGACGGLGLVAFYKALSRGAMGASAAISGLLAAAIPAVVSSFLEGLPGGLRLAGFAIAAVAIWLVAAGASPENVGSVRGTMVLSILSGAAFGVYFVALKLANPLGELMPITLARASGFAVLAVLALFLWLRSRGDGDADGSWWPAGWRWALAVALLDTGGNLLFIAATRVGRLDVTSVLTGLYPAATILLAAWHLHERPTRRQVVGMATALVAVVMVTL